MKLLMYILKKNDKLKIDNTTLGLAGIITKLNEEFQETVQAILNYSEDRTLLNLKEVMRETHDLIQMCILILWRFHRKALDFDEANLIQDINTEHNVKLKGRGWQVEKRIDVVIEEEYLWWI